MEKRGHFIVGIHITDRVRKVPDVQTVLTEYGCSIRTRLGLHDVQGDFCSPNGLVLLDMVCNDQVCQELMERLAEIEGVEVKRMVFGG
jgi:hypothetical protein